MRVSAHLLVVSATLVADALATDHIIDADAVRKSSSTSTMHSVQPDPIFFPPFDQKTQQGHLLDAQIETLCAANLLSFDECRTLARRGDPDAELAVHGLNKMCNIIAKEDCEELFADQSDKSTFVEGFRNHLQTQMQAYCDQQIAWACQLLGNAGRGPGLVPRNTQDISDYPLDVFVSGLCAEMPADACEGPFLKPRSQDEPRPQMAAELNDLCNRVGGNDCKALFEHRDSADATARQFVEGLVQGLSGRCDQGAGQACAVLQELGVPNTASKRQAPTQNTSLSTTSVSPAITIIKTITQTIEANCPFARVDDPNVSTVFMANVSGSVVKVTAASQRLDATRVLAFPAEPMGTLFPITVANDYLGDLLRFSLDSEALEQSYQHVLRTPLHMLRDAHSHLDWDSINRLGALLLNNRKDLDPETAIKHAMAFSLQKNVKSSSQSHLSVSVDGYNEDSSTIVNLSGTTFTMTAPTQTFNGDVFVATLTPKPFDVHYGALHPDEEPPACKKHRFSHACRVQKCMLRHHKPINITTVFPAVLRKDRQAEGKVTQLSIGYFTQATHVTTAHWGTTKANRVYYPATASWTTDKEGSPVQTMIRQTPGPDHLGILHSQHIAGNPECFDFDSCCKACEKHHGRVFFTPSNYLMWISGSAILGALSLLGLLTLCCCGGYLRGHQKRKRDPTLSRWEALPVIGRKFRSEKVDPNAGSDVAQVVSVVPVVAEGAGGVAAANGAGDGRGTLSRQAEEGRGRVNFAESAQPGQAATVVSSPTPAQNEASTIVDNGTQAAAGAVPTTIVTNSEGTVTGTGHDTAPQVQPTSPEVHRVDGAADFPTGRDIADMGSMRGRKKSVRRDMKGLFTLPAV